LHTIPIVGRTGRLYAGAAATLIASLMLAGCGSSRSDTSAADGTPAAASGTSANAAVAALVPKNIADNHVLRVATDATYPPMEYVDPKTGAVVGVDIDLANAIGAEMGLPVKITNTSFDSIIPSLQAGRYDLALSAFASSKERQKVVDFVTYGTAGSGFYEKSDGPHISGLADICGLSVGVQSGTTQATDAEKQSQKCIAAGKGKVTISVFPKQTAANLALSSGRVGVVMADSPIAAYAVTQSHGQFKTVGDIYDKAYYGIAIPRDQGTSPGTGPLTKAVQAAMQHLFTNGTYASILKKYGVQDAKIAEPKINDATF
jgi:polar amino acid transport system substrate-binding protein